MPHREAQKFLVRLMYDPKLLEKLKANPALLHGLSSEERASILSIDARALRADPVRRRRTLRGLLDELKISTTITLGEWRSFAKFEEGFFTSERFHKAITKDTLLVLALASFLEDEASAGRLKNAHLKEVLRYETACIQSRRAPALQPKQTILQERSVIKRASGVFGLKFSFDVISVVQHVEKFLFELSLLPQLALCEDAPRLPSLSLPIQEKRILITPTGGDVSLTSLDAGLYALLDALSSPREVKALYQVLAPFGVPPKQIIPLLTSLQNEGLLSS
jgi:hypothetical protein